MALLLGTLLVSAPPAAAFTYCSDPAGSIAPRYESPNGSTPYDSPTSTVAVFHAAGPGSPAGKCDIGWVSTCKLFVDGVDVRIPMVVESNATTNSCAGSGGLYQSPPWCSSDPSGCDIKLTNTTPFTTPGTHTLAALVGITWGCCGFQYPTQEVLANVSWTITVNTPPGPPQSLQASGGTDQISLTWSAPATNGGYLITSYKIYRGDASGAETFLATIGSNTSYVDATVGPAVGKYYEVTAANKLGEGGVSNEAHATTLADPPVSLALAPGVRNVSLSWDAPARGGVASYNVYRGPAAGTETLLANTSGANTTFTDATLGDDQSVHYEVTAVYPSGAESPPSPEQSTTTAPSSPRSPHATPGVGQVFLSWAAPASGGAQAYKIYRGTISGHESLLATLGTNTSYVDATLSDDQLVYYDVTAANDAESVSSPEVSATSAPSAPQSLALAPGIHQITLSWVAPASGGAAHYNIYRGASQGAESWLATIGANTSYVDTSLSDAQLEWYYVTATNDAESLHSNECTAATAPSAPASLATSPGDREITLAWSAPASGGAQSYKIYRGSASGTETLLATIGASTSYTDATLATNQTEYYQVSALNDAESLVSNEASGHSAGVPWPPRNLTADATLEGTLLVWNPPASDGGAKMTGYNVYRATSPSGPFNVIASGIAPTTYLDPQTASGDTTYFVSATNAVGESHSTTDVTPSFVVTALPQNGSIEISWHAGPDTSLFNIYRSTTLSSYALLATVDAEARTYVDSNLTNGNPYAYEVARNNAALAAPVVAIPDAHDSATSPFTVHGGTLGNDGWYTSAPTLDFDVNGPVDGSTYHNVRSINLVNDGSVRGTAVYLDEFESVAGWAVTAPDGNAVPSLSVQSQAMQGQNAVNVTLANDPTALTDSAPSIRKMIDVDVSAYDSLDVWIAYYTTSPIASNGNITLNLFDGTTKVFHDDIPLQSGWQHIVTSLGTTGSVHLTSAQFVLHEAKRAPGDTETQNFVLDGLKAYPSHALLASNLGETLWNVQLGDDTGAVQETRHFVTKVDTTTGVTTASVVGTAGDNGYYTSNVTVTLAASDPYSGIASIQYQIDNGSTQTYSTPFSIASDGQTCLSFWSVTNAGLTEAANEQCISIDRVPPTTKASVAGPAGENGWRTGTATVTLKATDATSGVWYTNYSLDQGPWQAYSTPISVAGDSASHTLSYYSTDKAGNVEQNENTVLKIDSQPPQTTVHLSGTPGANGYYVSNVTVDLTAIDKLSGVWFTNYTLDAGPDTPYGGTFTITTDNASHNLTFYSTDYAGNVEVAQSVLIAIDQTSPVTGSSVNGTGEGGFYSSNVNVMLQPTDETSGVASGRYNVDGGAWQSMPANGTNFTILNTSPGSYVVQYGSTDNAGNVETTKTLRFVIDTTPPEVTNRIPVPSSVVASATSVCANHDDAKGPGSDHVDYTRTMFTLEISSSSTLMGPWRQVSASLGSVSAGTASTCWNSSPSNPLGLPVGLYRVRGAVFDQALNSAPFQVAGDDNGWTFTVQPAP